MNFFKRPKKRVDERIENVRNQIYKEIYMIISVICLGSFFIKVLLFDVGAKGVVLELLIIIVSGVYYLARSIFLGVYWDEVELHDRSSKVPMSNKTIFTSVGLSLLIAIIMGINSAVNYADSTSQGLWYFVHGLACINRDLFTYFFTPFWWNIHCGEENSDEKQRRIIVGEFLEKYEIKTGKSREGFVAGRIG